MKPIKMTIRLAPITKKNSQQIITNKRTGRIMIIPSAKYREYEKYAGAFLKHRGEKLEGPLHVKTVFYMPTRRRCDLTNLLEAIHDTLVKYEVLADDSFRVIESVDGSRVLYDKDNPRTEILIEESRSCNSCWKSESELCKKCTDQKYYMDIPKDEIDPHEAD